MTVNGDYRKRDDGLVTVCPTFHSHPVTNPPLNVSQFSRSFNRVLDHLNITKTFGTHGIRHEFISYLVNRGVSSDQIGWLVGHSSSEITAFYSHVDERTLGNVLAGLS